MLNGKGVSPTITVITVVYNGAAYLEGTIRSVIAQTYPNIEYFIIDGGSTDGTVEVIKKYADRIKYWVSEKDSGIYDAMNKGWALAKEESFILFLGAGDTLVSLPENMDQFHTNEVIYGEVDIGGKYFPPEIDYHIKLYNSLHHQALLINKSLHKDIPFDLNYRVYADFDFNQRLYKKGIRFICSDSFRSYAMPGGISKKYPLAESLKIVRKNFGVFWSVLSLFYYLYNTGKVTIKNYARKIISR
jgi:glycosyltransferase involved in cell wall biosynthesis